MAAGRPSDPTDHAYHEAGHAVIAWVLGWSVLHVSIAPPQPVATVWPPAGLSGWSLRRGDTASILAGFVAEVISWPQRGIPVWPEQGIAWVHGHPEYTQAVTDFRNAGATDPEAEVRAIGAQAYRDLQQHWVRVETVAALLCQYQTLSPQQLAQLFP